MPSWVICLMFTVGTTRSLQKAKPFTLHCSLLLLVLSYAFLGGLIFNKLEAGALVRQQADEYDRRKACVLEVLTGRYGEPNATATTIMECWKTEVDERTEWSYVTSTLYGFGIVTTLGYNRIAPITHAGRMFCILYGICGIPITMIIIANVGQYLNQFARDSRIKMEQYRARRRRAKNAAPDEVSETSTSLTSLVLLIAFLLYVTFGALLLPLLNGELDFFNGLYFNFLCLTAIDFGQLVPQRVAFLPITFIYVCVGLAITTIAIDVGSEYMKKLHYIGKKMKDAASTKIWFGGKTLKVRDLLHAVGKKCGVEPSLIDAMDLDNVVECVIAISEGRAPPMNFHEEAPPREPTPRATSDQTKTMPSGPSSEVCPLLTDPPTPVKSNISETPSVLTRSSRTSSVSTQSVSSSDLILKNMTFTPHVAVIGTPTLDPPSLLDTALTEHEAVAINISSEDIPNNNTVIDFNEPEVLDQVKEVIEEENPFMIAESSHVTVVEEPPIRLLIEDDCDEEELGVDMQDDDDFSDKASTARSPTPEEGKVPRKFLEKKELYGRDAQKLFETYQEEWERLERLSGRRLGSRRKSVLASKSTFNLRSPDKSPSRKSNPPSRGSMDARIEHNSLSPQHLNV